MLEIVSIIYFYNKYVCNTVEQHAHGLPSKRCTAMHSKGVVFLNAETSKCSPIKYMGKKGYPYCI